MKKKEEKKKKIRKKDRQKKEGNWPNCNERVLSVLAFYFVMMGHSFVGGNNNTQHQQSQVAEREAGLEGGENRQHKNRTSPTTNPISSDNSQSKIKG